MQGLTKLDGLPFGVPFWLIAFGAAASAPPAMLNAWSLLSCTKLTAPKQHLRYALSMQQQHTDMLDSGVTVSLCLQCDKQPRPKTPRRGCYPCDCLCFAYHGHSGHSTTDIPSQLRQPSHCSHDCCSRYVQFCPSSIAWLDGTHVFVSCVIQ